MRAVIIALCLGATVGTLPPTEDEIDSLWARFQRKFTSFTSHASRFKAFRHNVLKAHKMNLDHGIVCSDLFDGPECVFGITKFSHMFADEFKMTMLGYEPRDKAGNVSLSAPMLNINDLPQAASTVDWRTKGAVTQVKNQGNCGSCWAYSAAEQIESAYFMATGKLPTLSTQQLISCNKGSAGCNGGNTETAFEYVARAGGLATEKDYPDRSHRTGRNGICWGPRHAAVKISGARYAVRDCQVGRCNFQDEEGLARVLAAKGPVSICVNAEPWQYYRGGIVSKRGCSGAGDAINHCVQLVGYNKAALTPYWIVRNSWSAEWGINGYIHLKMGENTCGVADDAIIVDIAQSDLLVV